VVGSLQLGALEHTPAAPKGKRLGRNACIGRVAQGQRGGGIESLGVRWELPDATHVLYGMRVLGVFENLAGKCVCLI